MPESRQRFLIIRLSSIGDIVHTLPAVAALGRAHPRAEIHWVVESRFSGLLGANPFISRLIKLDTLGWRKDPTSGKVMMEIMHGFEALREYEYDAAIDFQGLMKSAIFARLSHSKERIGLAWGSLREPLAALFYTQRVSPKRGAHIIEINLSLVEPLGAHSSRWEFPLPDYPEDRDAVRAELQRLRTEDFIIVNPGGGWKSKRWPPEHYAEMIGTLAGKVALDFLVTGSPQEEDVAREIIARAGTSRAKWFPSTLLQYIALAREARLLIGGDTGPLHLAAAVGTPIVAIFNAADPRNTPERNGPFNPADIILRGPRPARHRAQAKDSNYLEGVSVASVVNAALQRLGTEHE
ncbi:MAG: lipopolysaccharide heptosyltransferase I [Acidobacteria bacterium]|nr:MAG: lipopolysaccharide heptosyltransferase I [Acidobacteriota bacterium]